MLGIRDIQYFPDGRAVVDTVGERRFKVLSRGMRDGYHTAKVVFLSDAPVGASELEGMQSFSWIELFVPRKYVGVRLFGSLIPLCSSYESPSVLPLVADLRRVHDSTLRQARAWFATMGSNVRDGILAHYGPFPERVEPQEWWSDPDGPTWTWWILAILPLDPRNQVRVQHIRLLDMHQEVHTKAHKLGD